METSTPYKKEVSTAEFTSEEWKNRKLSRYGFFTWLIDIVLVAAIFSAMGNIAISLVPTVPAVEVQFWLTIQLILFIISMKKISRIWDPLNHYQTLIIRQ
jgi:hypothetical protein